MFSNKSAFLLAIASAAVAWWVGLCMDYDEVTNTILTMAAAIFDMAAAFTTASAAAIYHAFVVSLVVIFVLCEYVLLHPVKAALIIATPMLFYQTLHGLFIGAWYGFQQDIANKIATAMKIGLFLRNCYDRVLDSIASFSAFLLWFFPLLAISCIKASFVLLVAASVLLVMGYKVEEVAPSSMMNMMAYVLFTAFVLLVCDNDEAQQGHDDDVDFDDFDEEEEDGEEDEEEDGEEEEVGEEEEEEDDDEPPPFVIDFPELTRKTYLGAQYSESQDVAYCESYIVVLNRDFDDDFKNYDIVPFTDAVRVLQMILPEELSGHIKTFKDLDLSQFTTEDKLWRKVSRAIHPDKFSSAPQETRAMFQQLYQAVVNCRDNNCPFEPAPANYLSQQRQMVANELAQYRPVPANN